MPALPLPTRRLLLHLPLAGLTLMFGSGAATAQATSAAARETPWESLMPQGWDPMKEFRAGDAALVPEGSVKERNLMRQMREIWDNAPTNPKMDGAQVRLPGYVVPLEELKGELKEFLLVPYFGACVHSPPPPSNQIVHVIASSPLKGVRTMDAVWVNGTLTVQRTDSAMGVSSYQIKAPVVEAYVMKDRR